MIQVCDEKYFGKWGSEKLPKTKQYFLLFNNSAALQKSKGWEIWAWDNKNLGLLCLSRMFADESSHPASSISSQQQQQHRLSPNSEDAAGYSGDQPSSHLYTVLNNEYMVSNAGYYLRVLLPLRVSMCYELSKSEIHKQNKKFFFWCAFNEYANRRWIVHELKLRYCSKCTTINVFF